MVLSFVLVCLVVFLLSTSDILVLLYCVVPLCSNIVILFHMVLHDWGLFACKSD